MPSIQEETVVSAEYRKGTDLMLKRILTAVIAIPIGVLVLVLNNPHIIGAVTAALGTVAVYEVLSAAKYTKCKSISALSLVFSAGLPFFFYYDVIRPYVILFGVVFFIATCACFLMHHKTLRFSEVGLIVLISVCIPLALSTLSFFFFRFPEHGIFFIVFTLIVTWIADAGAYFAGTFLGKHKLAPEISPKKTWEGFFGGLAASVIFSVLTALAYQLFDYIFTGENHFTFNFIVIVVVAVVSTFLGLLGDLIASLLKRQCGVKDFGNLLPGHGGVMDRFDSVLFVAPFIYLVFQFFYPIIAI